MKYTWLILALACTLSSEVRADDKEDWLDLVRTIAARRGSGEKEPEKLKNLLDKLARLAKGTDDGLFIVNLLHDRRQTAGEPVRKKQIDWLTRQISVPAFPNFIRSKLEALRRLPEVP